MGNKKTSGSHRPKDVFYYLLVYFLNRLKSL